MLLVWIQPQYHDATTKDSSDSMYGKHNMPGMDRDSTLDRAGPLIMMTLACIWKAYSFNHRLWNFYLFESDHTHIQDPSLDQNPSLATMQSLRKAQHFILFSNIARKDLYGDRDQDIQRWGACLTENTGLWEKGGEDRIIFKVWPSSSQTRRNNFVHYTFISRRTSKGNYIYSRFSCFGFGHFSILLKKNGYRKMQKMLLYFLPGWNWDFSQPLKQYSRRQPYKRNHSSIQELQFPD